MDTTEKALASLLKKIKKGNAGSRDFAQAEIAINDTAWKAGAGKKMWDIFHEHYAQREKNKTVIQTKPLYNKIARFYEKEESRRKLLEIEEGAIRGLLPRKGTVLDAGCGTGRYCVLLAKRGCKVTGVDFSEEMLKQAKRRSKGLDIAYRIADVRRLPYPKSSFDHTICTLVLNHLWDWKKAARELVRVTRPGGSIVISLIHHERFESGPSKIFPFSKTDKKEVWAEEWCIPLKDLIKTANCKLTDRKEVSHPYFTGRLGLPTSKSPFLMIVKLRKR